jgi:hypothetical protein
MKLDEEVQSTNDGIQTEEGWLILRVVDSEEQKCERIGVVKM